MAGDMKQRCHLTCIYSIMKQWNTVRVVSQQIHLQYGKGLFFNSYFSLDMILWVFWGFNWMWTQWDSLSLFLVFVGCYTTVCLPPLPCPKIYVGTALFLPSLLIRRFPKDCHKCDLSISLSFFLSPPPPIYSTLLCDFIPMLMSVGLYAL